MVPKYRCWFKNSGIQAAHMVEWDKLKEFVGLGRLFDDSKKSTLFTLMQSTGLKDKNGVEIFEGDIVSVRNHPFQKTEKSGAGIEIDGDYAISWNEGDLTWCAGNLLLARLKPYVTVAGNIYENPELLEQANES
ncbi:YopX family protein [Enterococcus gallinarum]|uniref:YopX family protein n=1 Tax=Enterococcus gallinarum TaxID=1353 RepID=UPI003D11377E